MGANNIQLLSGGLVRLEPITNKVAYTQSIDLLTDLISVWELDETSAGAVVDSHGSNNGVNYNCTINQSSSPANLGKSYYMNGTTAYINVTDPFDFGENQDFTMSVWLNGTDNVTTNRPSILNKRQVDQPATGIDITYRYGPPLLDSNGNETQYGFMYVLDWGANQAYIGSGNNTVPSTTTTWQHLVCYRSGTTMGLVLNGGTPVTYTDAIVSGDLSNTNDFLIANERLKTRFYGACNFNQVAVWNKGLTYAEISAVYNSGDGLAYSSWE